MAGKYTLIDEACKAMGVDVPATKTIYSFGVGRMNFLYQVIVRPMSQSIVIFYRPYRGEYPPMKLVDYGDGVAIQFSVVTFISGGEPCDLWPAYARLQYERLELGPRHEDFLIALHYKNGDYLGRTGFCRIFPEYRRIG